MKIPKEQIENIKYRYSIFDVCNKIGIQLRGRNGLYRSPFREDKKPSFSISKDGKLFNDFATGEYGDVITFTKIALRCDFCYAIKFFDGDIPSHFQYCPRERKPIGIYEKEIKEKPKPIIPKLYWNEEKAVILKKLRGFDIESLKYVYDKGFFGFFERNGITYWIVKDKKGEVAQKRRLDGKSIIANGNEVKAFTLKNSTCSVPIGFNEEEIKNKTHIVLCEGSTDYLAAFHFIYLNGLIEEVVPLAMLGANHSIANRVCNALMDKKVLIIPDNDEAGEEAYRRWKAQLNPFAEVCRISFKDLHTDKGEPVKDLCDCIKSNFCVLQNKIWKWYGETNNPFINATNYFIKEKAKKNRKDLNQCK